MKIYVLLFLTLILNIDKAQSQLSGIFSFNFQTDAVCDISFYKDGLYEITINKIPSDDLGIVTTISFGKYTYNKGTITCIDQNNNFQTIFSYNPKYIKAKQAYFGFLNKKIPVSAYFSIEPGSRPVFLSYTKESKYKSINEFKAAFKKTHKIVYPFKTGVYDYSNFYTLTINPDHNYFFKFFGSTLSKGTWTRKGNELVLYDEDLKSFFYYFIEKDKLIGGFLSFFDEGNLIVRKKD